MYGSDAVGGVVNIISKKSRDTNGYSGSFEIMGGSFHMRSLLADLGFNHDWFTAAFGYRELKRRSAARAARRRRRRRPRIPCSPCRFAG